MNEAKKPPDETLRTLYDDHAAWSRHYVDQSTKINSLALVIAAAVLGLVESQNVEESGILGASLILVGLLSGMATVGCWSRSFHCWKIAVKLRRDFIDDEYFMGNIYRRASRDNHASFGIGILGSNTIGLFWVGINILIIIAGVYLSNIG